MTDLIKDFEEKASGKMMSFLRKNRSFEEDNIQMLREEIAVLGFPDPILVVFGRDAETVVRRNFENEFQIIRIPHYANYCSKETYRMQVAETLPKFVKTQPPDKAVQATPFRSVPDQ